MDLHRAREILSAVELPADFLFGVATAAYQIEGGLNGPGEPRNNWVDWERSGRAEPSARADDFWAAPEALLDRASALGLNGFRLGVEWARVEPAPGRPDAAALDRYAEILLGCRHRGLEPVVTLHHFSHPAWLGEAPWIGEAAARTVESFVEYVRAAVAGLGERLLRSGSQPLHYLVTLNEINILTIGSFVLGAFPPGRLADLRGAARTLDSLARAHVLAYDALHDLYAERGWTPPVVTTNNFSFGLYELDRMIVDVLTARQRGVAEAGLGADLRRQRARWYARLGQAPRAEGSRRWLEPLLQTLLEALLGEGLPGCAAAVCRSPRARKLDAIAIDFYDPFPECCLRLPGRRAGLGRTLLPLASLAETPVNPEAFRFFLARAADYGLPVLVLENGLCCEREGSRRAPRGDGWTRSRYLRAYLLAMAEALADGVPLAGYFHWTIADNYEWGSYRPRFGLHGVDRRGPTLEENDSMGEPSARAYAQLIRALREGDLAARQRAFLEER